MVNLDYQNKKNTILNRIFRPHPKHKMFFKKQILKVYFMGMSKVVSNLIFMWKWWRTLSGEIEAKLGMEQKQQQGSDKLEY